MSALSEKQVSGFTTPMASSLRRMLRGECELLATSRQSPATAFLKTALACQTTAHPITHEISGQWLGSGARRDQLRTQSASDAASHHVGGD